MFFYKYTYSDHVCISWRVNNFNNRQWVSIQYNRVFPNLFNISMLGLVLIDNVKLYRYYLGNTDIIQ